MIIKQRISLLEKILLAIVMVVLVVAITFMIAAAIWLSGHDLSFLVVGG